MKYTFIFFTLLFPLFTCSQNVFYKEYQTLGYAHLPTSIYELNKDTLLLLHSENQASMLDLQDSHCAMLDGEGNYLGRIPHAIDSVPFFLDFFSMNDKPYIMGCLMPDFEMQKVALFEIHGTDSITRKVFDSLPNTAMRNPKYFNINGRNIIATGLYPFGSDPYYSNSLHFFEIDDKLNILEHSSFDIVSITGVAFNPHDSLFYSFGCYDDILSICAFDLNFNIIKNISALTALNSNVCMVNNKLINFGFDFSENLQLITFNTSGVTQKTKLFEYPNIEMRPAELGSLCESQDGNFYTFGGQIIGNWPLSETPSFLHVAKVDGDLNVIWEKEIYDSVGYYPLKLVAAKDSGCYLLATVYHPEQNPDNYDMVVIKLDADGNYEYTTRVPSTGRIAGIKAYPNPGTSYFTFNISDEMLGGTITLINSKGQKAYSQRIESFNTSVNTSTLPQGIYLYEISTNSKIIGRGKWVKE